MTWEELEEEATINHLEFCAGLKMKPQIIEIVNITDLIENKYKTKDNNQKDYFFYITFRSEDFGDVDVPFTADIIGDGEDYILKIPKGHKLHAIASYVSKINGHIKIPFYELDEKLVGQHFKATSKRKSIGNNTYYIITPVLDSSLEVE